VAGKISKKDQDPNQVARDREALATLLSKPSQHFEPGTMVMYKGERYLLLCYRESDGKMVLDNERATHALDTYSMLNHPGR